MKALLSQALLGNSDWQSTGARSLDALCGAAADHGIEALLWEALAGAGGEGPALRALLEPRVRAAVARELFVKRDLQAVLTALDGAGLPALLTKGTALAYTVYPQPWLRPRVDSDLLVRHTDVAAAARALESCGYVRTDKLSSGELVSHQIAFERTDAHDVHHVIDLHWKLANPQVVADTLPFDVLWRDAQVVDALGPAARVPSTAGSLAVACVHRLAHHHGQDRLIWLYDLKLLAAALDADGWATLGELACTRGVAGFCLDGLRSARESLGTYVPRDIEEKLSAAAPDEPSRTYVEGPVTRRETLLNDLKVLESWSDRIRLMREHAFPPVAFIRQRYGTRSRLLLPALYLHRLVTGASRWVRS